MTSPDYFVILSIMAFVLGTAIGSFLNVCILRLPLGMGVDNPKRSFCFRCGARIAWYDNLPIISYLVLRGRDRNCGSSYSARYMLIELFTGICFLLLLWSWNTPGIGPSGFSLMTFWYLIFTSLLIIAIFTDFDHWIHIPSHSRWGTVVALGFALLAGFFDKDSMIALSGPFPYIRLEHFDWVETVVEILAGPAQELPKGVELYWWEPLANAAFGAFFGPGLIFLIGYLWKLVRGQDGMGFGDVELFVMIGATFGAVNSLLILVIASFAGSIVGVTGIIANKLSNRQSSPLDLGRWSGSASPEELKFEQTPSNANSQPVPDEHEREHAEKFAASLGLEFINLLEVQWDQELIDQFPAVLAMEELALPLKKDAKSYTLVVSNPLSSQLISEAKRALNNADIHFKISTETDLLREAERLFGERYEAQKSAEEGKESQVKSAAQARRKRWQEFSRLAAALPRQKPSPSLPFIPWIAVGCFVLLFAYPTVLGIMNFLFVSPLDFEPLRVPAAEVKQP